MGILDKILRRRRRHTRIDVELPVRIADHDETFKSQDLAQAGMRMNVGRQVSLGDITKGRREIQLSIEIGDGQTVVVTGEPIWTVRLDSGDLSTGWMFTSYDGDGLNQLKSFIDAYE